MCEAIEKLGAVAGKPFAIVGRLSFRDGSESLSQDACANGGGTNGASVLELEFDAKDAPRVKTGWEVNGRAMQEKLKLVRGSTKLASFPFGTSDYDRWAVVYGCLKRSATPGSRAAARLLYAGDGYVMVVK